jgi:hypothetical protein
MGGGGFEPPKRNAADLQSAPFGHLGTRPSNRHIFLNSQASLAVARLTSILITFEKVKSSGGKRCVLESQAVDASPSVSAARLPRHQVRVGVPPSLRSEKDPAENPRAAQTA